MPLRVLHLVGSAQSEFYGELSKLYARDCLATVADPERYEPIVAYVTPDGCWRFTVGLDDSEIEAATPVRLSAAVEILEGLEVDVALPQMFCLPGMTSYRALLELLDIPYVGNRPEAMALTADKARAKSAVAGAGVAVPAGEVVGPGESPAVPLRLPAVVKPLDADNSLGLSLVREPADFEVALEAAREHSERVLIETYVELGREVRCGVLEIDGELVPLPLEEYAVDRELMPIRSYAEKIRREDGELSLVAKDGVRARIVELSNPVTREVWEVAKRCHTALGCRHYSLFDFRIDPRGKPWFLEAGLYCSFARQSVIATMAAASGLTTEKLFALAVRGATSSASLEASR